MKYSIVMPAKNEESNIRKAVQILLDQTLKPDEVIVVDAGSTDNTLSILKEIQKTNPILKVVHLDSAFPGRARNAAIKEVKNEIILMIDAGMYAESDWAQNLIREVEEDPDTDVVFGSTSFITDTFFEKCNAIALGLPSSHIVKIGGKKFKTHAIHSSAIKRSVWGMIGGFLENVSSAEDKVFVERIRQNNFKIRYAPDAKIHWIPRQKFKEIFALGRRQGRDIYVLKIEKIYILKSVLYNVLLFYFLFIGFAYSSWYFLYFFLLILARLIQKLSNSPDISKKVAFNIFAFGVISYMFILHGIGVLLGYFEQMFSKRYLN